MIYNFVTLFDKNYLYKGLALHQSMMRHIQSFQLWILCLDDLTYEILSKIELPRVELIKMLDFEDSELKKIKTTRTLQEYYWTLSSSLPLYVLKRYQNLDHIGYIDADLFFYSDVKPILKEWGDNSILIIPHDFPPYFKHKEKQVGRFIVSMVLFKNNTNARACLNWWRKKVIEWCYYRTEKGRLGDQIYLEEWPTRFNDVHILKHKGGMLAPWNVMYYRLTQKDKTIFVENDPLIFYHFHSFRLLEGNNYEYTFGYELSAARSKLIYDPYVKAIKKAKAMVEKVSPNFRHGYSASRTLQQKTVNYLYVTKLKLQRIFKL